tara:strand:- start:2588 stop:3238 length:651 start_codon:yes stop_codon:yes gene_type:complete
LLKNRMHHRNILVFSSGVIAVLFGYYISLKEAEPQFLDPKTNKNAEEVQLLNRGEPKVTKKPGFSQIGRFQAKIPNSWLREQPSTNMRLAQFKLPGPLGVAELVVFSGIGGSIDENLNRWYGQFKNINETNVKSEVERSTEIIRDMSVTFAYLEGTYLKSNFGMGGAAEEMNDYAMLAAIMSSSYGPYYFKTTGPKKTILDHKQTIISFIRSIDYL